METLCGHLGEVKMTLHCFSVCQMQDIATDYLEVWGQPRCGRTQANWGYCLHPRPPAPPTTTISTLPLHPSPRLDPLPSYSTTPTSLFNSSARPSLPLAWSLLSPCTTYPASAMMAADLMGVSQVTTNSTRSQDEIALKLPTYSLISFSLIWVT